MLLYNMFLTNQPNLNVIILSDFINYDIQNRLYLLFLTLLHILLLNKKLY